MALLFAACIAVDTPVRVSTYAKKVRAAFTARFASGSSSRRRFGCAKLALFLIGWRASKTDAKLFSTLRISAE